MNNNKTTNILLAILILLLMAFGVYYFINNDSEDKDINEENNTVEKTPFEKKIEEKKSSLPITISNLNADKNLETQMELIIDKIEVKANGDVYLTVNQRMANQYASYYKLMSDVVDVEVEEYGQGGYRAIIFVKSDGTVSLINPTLLLEKAEINVEDNIGNLKNIVDIDTYFAIDIDGIKHVLTSYFYDID